MKLKYYAIKLRNSNFFWCGLTARRWEGWLEESSLSNGEGFLHIFYNIDAARRKTEKIPGCVSVEIVDVTIEVGNQ
jgi:hypothetical protein